MSQAPAYHWRLRHWLDKTFTGLALLSVLAVVMALIFILLPMLWRGAGAVFFRGTVEFRKMQLHEKELGNRGNKAEIDAETAQTDKARAPVYEMLAKFKENLDTTALRKKARELKRQYVDTRGVDEDKSRRVQKAFDALRDAYDAKTIKEANERLAAVEAQKEADFTGTPAAGLFKMARDYKDLINRIGFDYQEVETLVRDLLGPRPQDATNAALPAHNQYGATRWDLSLALTDKLLYKTVYITQGMDANGHPLPDKESRISRQEQFEGTALEGLFPYVQGHLSEMMNPRFTFYWHYFTDDSTMGHYFGGVWPEVYGTLLLTVLTILFSLPLGVTTAAYLVESAGNGIVVRVIRTCINTLAGVPSIVFGLFGMAFFAGALPGFLGLPAKPSIMAGSMTLAVLVLPVIIRASEEAIRSVPPTYKEAALGLGASKFRCFVTVTLPAALPGVLTGVILSMSRAAGETAPILYTAAVAVGNIPNSLLDQTRTLSYSSYYMAKSDKIAMMVPHQQYGMVMTLVLLVLVLNLAAIVLRGRVAKRLRGQ